MLSVKNTLEEYLPMLILGALHTRERLGCRKIYLLLVLGRDDRTDVFWGLETRLNGFGQTIKDLLSLRIAHKIEGLNFPVGVRAD